MTTLSQPSPMHDHLRIHFHLRQLLPLMFPSHLRFHPSQGLILAYTLQST